MWNYIAFNPHIAAARRCSTSILAGRGSALKLRAQGLYTFVRWNTIMTNPPLCINEAELDEGFEILDTALEIGDRAGV